MKKAIMIALAFVGAVVGAGFASGQEILQYYVSHGTLGLIAVGVSAIALVLVGYTTFQLGSYELATEHSVVFDKIASPWLSRAMDFFIVFSLFCVGFVMIAGAGSNLNQQFGLPVWVGSLAMALLVAAVGLLDVSKVTAVIGGITPFIIVTIVAAAIYSVMNPVAPMPELLASAATVDPAIGNWLLSAVNYVALVFAMGSSIMIVMGGDVIDPKSAGRGGVLGGIAFGVLMMIAAAALLFQLTLVKDAPMPMLALVESINPVFGTVMAIIIFGMIFNTAIGMYYAIAKRASVHHPKRFKPVLFGTVALGFALSFVGFEPLVNKLYPILGYVGIVMIVLVWRGWLKQRKTIVEEAERRHRIRALFKRRWTKGKRYTKAQHEELVAAVEESNLDNKELLSTMREETVDAIVADPDAELEPALVKKYGWSEESGFDREPPEDVQALAHPAQYDATSHPDDSGASASPSSSKGTKTS